MARHVFRDALGRQEDEGDGCSIAGALGRAGEGRSLRELILGVVTSDAFRHVRPADREDVSESEVCDG